MSKKILTGIVLALLMIMSAALPASAHENRPVGDNVYIFGWRNEPALTNVSNGPEVFIFGQLDNGERGEPITDAELQVEISFGPETLTLPMRPAFGDPGHYIADLIPTLPGDYTFRLTGTAGGVEIDEMFTSADGEFSSVEPTSDVQFPRATPDLFELLAQIEDLQAQIADLQAQLDALQDS